MFRVYTCYPSLRKLVSLLVDNGNDGENIPFTSKFISHNESTDVKNLLLSGLPYQILSYKHN